MALRSYLVQFGWDRNLVIEIVTKLYCESSNKGWLNRGGKSVFCKMTPPNHVWSLMLWIIFANDGKQIFQKK